MDWILNTFRENPSLAIFLTVGLGFWVGRFKYKSFTLGTVTSVLLIGVLVGQMNIPIPGPVKQVFFLLFLFAIGYSVGPQFFAALRGSGVKQVIFAVVECVLCLLCTWGVAKALGYNPGESVGLFGGAQTISAVIGAGGDMISSLNIDPATKQKWIEIIPVCYAVTYIFGTIGSAYILGILGPKMLGGMKKVREATRQLEASMSDDSITDDPAFMDANRPVVFRSYKVAGDFFSQPRKVSEIEAHCQEMGRRIFVERLRIDGNIIDPTPDMTVKKGDEVVLSGRREYVIQDESWIGPEVNDAKLLTFPVEKVDVMLTKKGCPKGTTVNSVRNSKFMYGVMISKIQRGKVEIPVLARTELMPGDIMTISGLKNEVDPAGTRLGSVERKSNVSDLIFVGLGIFLGVLVGALSITIGGIPVSLSTSGGALISGLILGWWRTRHPSVGYIPKAAEWLMNNLGLNVFIAIIGITAGPTFISGLEQVGWMLFVGGVIATTVPLLICLWLGDKVFKFHPAINLGCCAGSRTTTAALGAIEESLGSSIPALGYAVTYAIGNTMLILMGVAMVIMTV